VLAGSAKGSSMTLDPESLRTNPDLLEDIEKATLRFVTQAIYNFREDIIDIFTKESDLVQDIGEDLTREALDRTGTSLIPQRLFGKMDFKRARYLFLPEHAVRQALFVDSKAEKGSVVARIQKGQTSMNIRQIRAGQNVNEPGGLPLTIPHASGDLLTTTIFVKYAYKEILPGHEKTLQRIDVIALPSGYLQNKYNPSFTDTIWNAGPNAPTLGEPFRARIALTKLRQKANWRVQTIPPDLLHPYVWAE